MGFFFNQKQVRDSQRVLVRTLAYAPFNLEPLSPQKPHYSFRPLGKKALLLFWGWGHIWPIIQLLFSQETAHFTVIDVNEAGLDLALLQTFLRLH